MNTEPLIPFNLQDAIKGASIVYRSGEEPLEWHYFQRVNGFAHCIITVDLSRNLNTHYSNGRFRDGESARDLFMMPVPPIKIHRDIVSDKELIDEYMNVDPELTSTYTTWIMIMPVWSKISAWGLTEFTDKWKCIIAHNGVIIQVGQFGHIFAANTNTPIDICNACIAFIKWYNNGGK